MSRKNDFTRPVPTKSFGSDDVEAQPQTMRQKEFEARIDEIGDTLSRRQGLSRREFFSCAAGMAASFLALNETFGAFFAVDPAEASVPGIAKERAEALKDQFIMDMHTHFLRDDTRLNGFVKMREAVGKAGWNPALVGKPQHIDDLKFSNYLKEIYLDSDTKIACISSAPSEIPQDWFLTNDMAAKARETINAIAGSRRSYAHAIFTPGMPGWLDEVDRAIEMLKPDSFKGYTIGDNTHKDLSKHPWRMDDEKLTYPAYEKFLKAGLRNVCVHKGLFPPARAKQFPHLLPFCDVRDVGKAAKDWPGLNFIIYHAGYRFAGGATAEDAWQQFKRTGRIEWVTDLSEIPSRYDVSNVYADLGQIFAQSVIAEPRVAAVMLGQLIRGLGADHVCWGTDALWSGSPQWQIEAIRRLEIPEYLRKSHRFDPLGPANGPVKTVILGVNNARLYGLQTKQINALTGDGIDKLKHL